MCKGMVFNIQKFSVHDGPGIRTTVFLKDCPLHCRRCSSPESQLSKVRVLYDVSICIQDGVCIQACPQRAVQREGSRIVINDTQCLGCSRYIATCKAKALQVEGVCRDANEVVTAYLQDRNLYEKSQGGVILSSGEALAQLSFAKALVLRLKQEGVHVVIETAGYIQPTIFQKPVPLFDLSPFDIKHYDTGQYILGAGVNNDLILENLAWNVKHQLCVLPRIPITPGYNTPLQDAKGLAALFTSLSVQRVQFLPFHQFGEKRYEMLNHDYGMKHEKALHSEDLRDYRRIFLNQGTDCFS